MEDQAEFPGTNLVPAASALPARVEAVSLGNIDEKDLSFPFLLLAQPTSVDRIAQNTGAIGLSSGVFVHNFTGETFKPPLKVLVVHYNKTRALQPDPDKAEYKGTELCISRDGIVGSKYGTCRTCRFAQWRDTEDGRRGKPLCAESALLTVLTPKGPMMLRVKRGTKQNTEAVKRMLSAVAMESRELWDRYLVVGCEKQTPTQQGRSPYYTFTLTWDRASEVPDAVKESARAAFEMVHSAWEAGRLQTDDDGSNGNEEAPEPWDK